MKKRNTKLLNVTLSLQAELDDEIFSEDDVSPEVFFNMISNKGSLNFKYNREWYGEDTMIKWFEITESYNNRLLGTIEFEYEDKWEEVENND